MTKEISDYLVICIGRGSGHLCFRRACAFEVSSHVDESLCDADLILIDGSV